MSLQVKVKKTQHDAIIPEYKTKGAAGFDIPVIEDIFIPANSAYIEEDEYSINAKLRNNNHVVGGTGLAFEIPEGYELEIRGRSGNAFKYRVFSYNGTIDSDYRNEVKLLLVNLGNEDMRFKKGERVAQGVIKKIEQVNFIESDELSETERGLNGFGSTGLK